MPEDFAGYQQLDDLHFVTLTCFEGKTYLESEASRDLFVQVLEAGRERFGFVVAGYVVLTECAHLLMGQPKAGRLDGVLEAVKAAVAREFPHQPFWEPTQQDTRLRLEVTHAEILRAIHHDPVKRGLAKEPDAWKWSSSLHWRNGTQGLVKVTSPWSKLAQRMRREAMPQRKLG